MTATSEMKELTPAMILLLIRAEGGLDAVDWSRLARRRQGPYCQTGVQPYCNPRSGPGNRGEHRDLQRRSKTTNPEVL